MKKEFNIIIEQDEDGYYIASVPELPGCHTQAKSLDELNKRIIEAIEISEIQAKEKNKELIMTRNKGNSSFRPIRAYPSS